LWACYNIRTRVNIIGKNNNVKNVIVCVYIFCTLTLGHQRRWWLLRLPIYHYYYIMLYTYNYYTAIPIFYDIKTQMLRRRTTPPLHHHPLIIVVPGTVEGGRFSGGGDVHPYRKWRRRWRRRHRRRRRLRSTQRHASCDQCVRRRSYGDYTVDATGPVGLRRSVY